MKGGGACQSMSSRSMLRISGAVFVSVLTLLPVPCDEGRKTEHSGERDTVRVRDLFLGFVAATLAFQFPNFDWNWGYGCETSNWTNILLVSQLTWIQARFGWDLVDDDDDDDIL